jgi:murein DD-endopeptidase MepM/ murein hydrolase activator NlpD
MARGVEVRAAAPGVVRNVRDGMPDEGVGDPAARARIAGRECGNGVLLEHAGGWQTQYCHLRNASVRVAPGQQVEAGAPLALVGLSGQTEFPHLHLAVRHAGRAHDPFTGLPAGAGCTGDAVPLWGAESGLDYETVALYNAGFAPGPPDIDAIRRGERTDGPLSREASALVLWVDVFGVRAEDRLRLRVTGPGGAVLVDTVQPLERDRARHYGFAGKRRTLRAWPAGVYEGTIEHTRGSAAPTVRRVSITVE